MSQMKPRMLEVKTKPYVAGRAANFVVERFSGREEMSRMFEYQLDMVSERDDIAPKDLLGTNATVSLELAGGQGHRHFNGYITRFVQLGEVRTPAFSSGVGFRYQVTLNPWLWFLTRTSTCFISCDDTFQTVIDTVCKRWAALAAFKFDLNGDTETRKYLVQYRETDFNYISRLAEQAGLYYHFSHENGKHELVFTDHSSKHVVTPQLPVMDFKPDKRDDVGVSAWDCRAEVQPGAYAIDDFDPLKPRSALIKVQSMERPHANAGFELYDFPGEYTDPAWGEKYAKMRVEELNCRHELFRGATEQRLIQVGFKFSLKKHPVASQNQEYLVIGHSFSAVNNLSASGPGEGAKFSCDFTAIPAATQFRAARVTPKPSIPGPQTAFVVGPAGEEIHTDKYGRVQLQFHWDRYAKGDNTKQCWVRVSQALAGKGWGWVNLPRVGQEVVVEFLDGDPDAPLVTGRVYNAEATPPYLLPDKKTRTGMITRTYKGGNDDFNELRFDDATGEEQVYLQAQRNLDFRVKKDINEWVGGKSDRIVEKDVFEKFLADYHLDLAGDHNNKIGGSLSHAVSQNAHMKAAKILHEAQQEIHLKGGPKIILEASAQISLKVGGNFIDINPGGVFIKGTMVMVNSGGSAGSGSGAGPIAAKAATEAIKSAGGKKDDPPKARPAVTLFSAQATSFKTAAVTGAPFCAVCEGC